MAIRFGPFRLDPVERQLHREGELLDVQDQVIEVLAALTERPGGLWTREELHARLWPDAIVSEDALFQALAKTRKALGDPARKPLYIATVAGQGYRFVAAVEADAAPPPRATPGAEPLPLPATALVGRDALLDRLCAELAAAGGLWTLTGPGGMGKTRLALEVAARHVGGAAFCDLQAATTTVEVWAALGRCLHLTARVLDEPARVCAELAARGDLLVLLDNAEQVVEPLAAVVLQVLGAAPACRLLVTSRIRLGVAAERLVDLAPLADPAPDADLVTLAAAPAGALLLDRAARLGVHPTADQAADLAALCRALGGLPLAIELAAPRLRLLTPAQLLARMDRHLDLLGAASADRPARHHSLRSAIAASWELLDPELQQALAQLALFAGPFSAEVAEATLHLPGGDPLLALAELIDHSLVRRREDRPDRPLLELLPSIRSFARGHLDPAARTATLDRLARAYAALSRQPGPEDIAAWQAAMERDSLVLALEHAVTAGAADAAAGVARALCRTLLAHGPLHEVASRLDPVLALPALAPAARTELLLLEAEARLASTEVEAAGALLDLAEAALPPDSPLAGPLARLRGAWLFRRGDIAPARAALARGLELPGLSGTERARMLLLRGQIEIYAVMSEAAVATLEEARALVEALDLRALRAELLYELGCVHLAFVGLRSGQALLEQSLASALAEGNPVAAARARAMLGRALLHLRHRAEAEQALDAAEPVLRRAGLVQELGTLIDSRAHLASDAGRLEDAAALLHEAIALLDAAGQVSTLMDPRVTRATVLVRMGRLDEAEAELLAALEVFRRQGRNPAMALHNLGEIDLRRGRLDSARQRLRAARLAFAAGGKPLSEGLAWVTLGEVELAADDPVAAVGPLRKGVEVIRSRDRADVLAQALAYLGLALGRAGQPEQAAAAFDEALALTEADRLRALRPFVLGKQARLALDIGDLERARALREQARVGVGDRVPAEVRVVLDDLDRALAAGPG